MLSKSTIHSRDEVEIFDRLCIILAIDESEWRIYSYDVKHYGTRYWYAIDEMKIVNRISINKLDVAAEKCDVRQ